MAVILKSSLQLAVSHGVKVMVYARAGFGKTVLIATAPNPIMLSAESGLLCLSRANLEKMFGKNNPTITYDIPVIEINSVEDLTAAHLWLTTHKDAKQFETICLDSVSEIAEQVLTNAKGQVKDGRMAYGELIEKMTDVFKKFRDIKGKHIYFAAKEEYAKDEVNGISKFVPSMPGSKLGQASPYLFDEVFHLGIAKTKEGKTYRFLRTQPDMQYDAKDRSGMLAEVEEPNLTKIFNKILSQGKVAKKAPPVKKA